MRRLAVLTGLFVVAGCGSQYSPNNDLPLTPGTAYVIPQVCRPCTSDADCGAASFCVTEDASGLQYCSAPCNDFASCDGDGQTCFTVDDNGNTGCYPSSGSCEMYLASTGGNGSGAGSTTETAGTTTIGTTTASGTTGSTTTATGTAGTTSSSTTTTTGTTGSCFPDGAYVGAGNSAMCCSTLVDASGYCATTATSGTSSTSTSATASTTGTTATSTTGTTATSTTGTTATSTTSTSTSTSGTTGTTGACTPDSWTTDMQSFFSNNCSGCHNPTRTWVRNNASSIESRVQSGNMPQGGSLTQSQKDMVVNWINCGEP